MQSAGTRCSSWPSCSRSSLWVSRGTQQCSLVSHPGPSGPFTTALHFIFQWGNQDIFFQYFPKHLSSLSLKSSVFQRPQSQPSELSAGTGVGQQPGLRRTGFRVQGPPSLLCLTSLLHHGRSGHPQRPAGPGRGPGPSGRGTAGEGAASAGRCTSRNRAWPRRRGWGGGYTREALSAPLPHSFWTSRAFHPHCGHRSTSRPLASDRTGAADPPRFSSSSQDWPGTSKAPLSSPCRPLCLLLMARMQQIEGSLTG